MQNNIVEKTVYLDESLERKIQEIIATNRGLSFSVIINQALKEWLGQPQSINPDRNCFIIDAPKGFGPIYNV